MDKINFPLNSYSNRQEINKTSIAIDGKLTTKQEDTILESVSDLVLIAYKSWFILRLREVGPAKFMAAADKARKFGRDKPRYFAALVRK